MSLLDRARELRAQQLQEVEQQAAALRSRLQRGEAVPPAEVKRWRRGCIDRAVAIRSLARQAGADELGAIREQVEIVEERARDLERELLPDAEWLSRAEKRGGVLTPEERARRAAEQGKVARHTTCRTCGAPASDAVTETCEFCGASLAAKTDAERAALLAGQSVKVAWPEGAEAVGQHALATLDALESRFNQQLEAERRGLLAVLEAGKRRTNAYYAAVEDAEDRLDRLWEHVRKFGLLARDRLDDLGAYELDDRVDDRTDQLCDRLLDLQRVMLDSVARAAQHAWNRDDANEAVYCTNCGGQLEVDTSSDGEATCPYCQTVVRYSARLNYFEAGINRRIDEQMEDQRPVEEVFEYWKARCTSAATAETLEQLRRSAEAMYSKQLFYIKDPDKHRAAVERYVKQALAEFD
jgi:ribosomal protein L37E